MKLVRQLNQDKKDNMELMKQVTHRSVRVEILEGEIKRKNFIVKRIQEESSDQEKEE